MKKWRRDLDNSRNGLPTLERWGFPTADLWFENLYRQIKVNWINGWKDDRSLADYSHYLSLCCSTRRVDLADFIFSSCKGVNMAWRDRQSAKVWNTRIGRRGIKHYIRQLWHGLQSIKAKKSIFWMLLQPRWSVVPFLPPWPLQHTSDQDPVNQCMTIQNPAPSAIHSFQLLNRTTCFPAFFQRDRYQRRLVYALYILL